MMLSHSIKEEIMRASIEYLSNKPIKSFAQTNRKYYFCNENQMRKDMDNQEEIFPEVNEQGEVIGKITRGQAHNGSKILHPVVHLHVFNSKGDLFLQHRPAWKDITLRTQYPCSGPASTPIKCTHHHGSPVSLEEAIEQSCNPYFWCAFRDMLQRGGYGEENENFRNNYEVWRDDMLSFGFGQRFEDPSSAFGAPLL